MDPFLLKFFPSVYRSKHDDSSKNQYCQYNSETLTMFTSSLYLAALLSSLVASIVTRKLGRKPSMLLGGLLFFAGALLNGFAQAVWMLIVGRILLGFGIGFANQVFFFFFFWFWIMIFIFGVFLCFGTKKVVGREQQQKRKRKYCVVWKQNEAHIQYDIPLVLVMSVFLFFFSFLSLYMPLCICILRFVETLLLLFFTF